MVCLRMSTSTVVKAFIITSYSCKDFSGFDLFKKIKGHLLSKLWEVRLREGTLSWCLFKSACLPGF